MKSQQAPSTLVLLTVVHLFHNVRLFVGAADKPNFGGARRFPICIKPETINEYATELKYAKDAADYLKEALSEVNSKNAKIQQSPAAESGVGIMEQIQFLRIRTNLEGYKDTYEQETYRFFKYLRQWIHINIDMNEYVDFLVVQANMYPFGLPWGVFDIEYAGVDCGKDYPVINAKDGNALDFGKQAAVIPCHKRAYLHSRHPYVYVYQGAKQKNFHMNFNYLDITCREMKMLQFLIIARQSNGKYSFLRTAVIDHFELLDSADGIPYPVHPDLINNLTMHEESHGFATAKGGDTGVIPFNKDYDDCVKASDAEFEKTHKEADDLFLSNWVCKKPPRYSCDFNNSANAPPGKAGGDGLVEAPDMCNVCDEDDNSFIREVNQRLITRGYMIRRVHGDGMTLGCISMAAVSCMIARYFKETKGPCLLVGWWLWAHLFLTFICKGAVWVGFVGALLIPERQEVTVSHLIEPRKKLVLHHKLIGSLGFFLFNVIWVSGLVSPKGGMAKTVATWLHFISGYLTIVVAVGSVILSTACLEPKVFSIISLLLVIIVFVLGCVLQFLMDKKKTVFPRRKYCPLVEAVSVPREMPLCMMRTIMLSVFSFLVLFIWVITVLKGSHHGLFIRNPCNNCRWKYDELIRTPGDSAKLTPMYTMFGCVLKNVTFQEEKLE